MSLILENVQSVRRAPVNTTCPQCKQNIERDTQCCRATAVEACGTSDIYMHLDCHKAWIEYVKLLTMLFPANTAGWLRDADAIFSVWLGSSFSRVYERIFGKKDVKPEPPISQTMLVASHDIKKGSIIGVCRPQEAGWVNTGNRWLAPDGMVVEHPVIPFVCTAVTTMQ